MNNHIPTPLLDMIAEHLMTHAPALYDELVKVRSSPAGSHHRGRQAGCSDSLSAIMEGAQIGRASTR